MYARAYLIVDVLLREQCAMSVSVSVPVCECVCVCVCVFVLLLPPLALFSLCRKGRKKMRSRRVLGDRKGWHGPHHTFNVPPLRWFLLFLFLLLCLCFLLYHYPHTHTHTPTYTAMLRLSARNLKAVAAASQGKDLCVRGDPYVCVCVYVCCCWTSD